MAEDERYHYIKDLIVKPRRYLLFRKRVRDFLEKADEKKENQKFANDINIVLKNYGIQKTINHTHLVRIKSPGMDSYPYLIFRLGKKMLTGWQKLLKTIFGIILKNTHTYIILQKKSLQNLLNHQKN